MYFSKYPCEFMIVFRPQRNEIYTLIMYIPFTKLMGYENLIVLFIA